MDIPKSNLKNEKSRGNQIIGSILTGNIALGKGCQIYHASLNGEITVGDYTSIWGPNLVMEGNIHIGSFCSIARNVSLQETFHNHNRITSYFIWKNLFKEKSANEIYSKGKIIIGSDVWIGMNSSVLSGVKIGNGAVIGANTLVNTDVPPYAIFVGVPGQVIKYRFDQQIINRLVEIKWWKWSLNKIYRNKKLFEKNLALEMLEKIL